MKHIFWLCMVAVFCGSTGLAQQTATSSGTAVPHLVHFGGVIKGSAGQSLAGPTGVTFALYREQEGGAPLWLETQNVIPDNSGHYSVSLGASKADGLPVELFTSGEARWLGVQPQGQAEQPRVLLLSVPYALKAGDAETLGGMPASAFVAASRSTSSSGNAIAPPVLSGGGKKNYVPLWLTPSKLGSSKLFQSSAGNLGIGTTTPAAGLDVNGTGDIRNTLTLFPNGSSPTLSVNGTAFGVDNTGLVKFVSGQTFPGTGTITGVTAGADLTGGGTTGNVTLNLDTAKVPLLASANTFNASQTVKGNLTLSGNGNGVIFADGTKQTTAGGGTITGVTAGTDLTGGGNSGNVTLNLDTTKVPQLNANNAFTMNNSFAGTVGVGTTTPGAQLDVEAPATAGTGIQGVTSSTAFFAAGVFGHATGTSGETRGVYGASDSPSGIGVHGIGAVGGQFETGNGAIFVGRGQGGTRVTIDSLGNTFTSGGISTGGPMTAGGSITAGGGLSTTVTGGATAVFASSDTGTGVFGGGGVGVIGDSTSGIGVQGFGVSTGVYGKASASGGSANGVQGASTNATAVRGDDGGGGSGVVGTSVSGAGVFGITHSASGSGVSGVNDAPGGTGVFGSSTNGGYGFVADSHVQQARTMGGWVKAMIFVDPFTGNGTAITRCFNLQATGATVWTPPCGFSILHEQQGEDLIDFGFQVNDRFISTTAFGGSGMTACILDSDNQCLADGFFPPTDTQIVTDTFVGGGALVDVAFWVIIF